MILTKKKKKAKHKPGKARPMAVWVTAVPQTRPRRLGQPAHPNVLKTVLNKSQAVGRDIKCWGLGIFLLRKELTYYVQALVSTPSIQHSSRFVFYFFKVTK